MQQARLGEEKWGGKVDSLICTIFFVDGVE